MRRFILQLICAIGVVLLISPAVSVLWGQASSAVILGTVTDQSGAVIPGVAITLTNKESGVTHTALSNDSGAYRIPQLNPGTYTVTAELTGFKKERHEGIQVTIAQQLTLNFELKVGGVTEEVVVEGKTPLLEATTSTISGLVDEKQIRNLPLNKRDFYSLAYLQTGAAQQLMGGSNPWTAEGGIMKLALNGMRPTASSLLVDGTDANEPTYNVPPAGASGAALGVEAIREFRVLTSNYSAEYGRNMGGIITTVTKSGTNELHGSGYIFHRNKVLDARSFFDPEKPQFRRHQFGFTLGGPIKKDRTFIFGNYEGLRELKGITSNTPVPDLNARKGLLPDPARPGQFINVGIDSRIVPFMNLYPLPTTDPLGGGIARWVGAKDRTIRDDYFVVRFDHSFSENDNVMVRYIFGDSTALKPFQGTLTPGFPANADRSNQYVTIQYAKVFSKNFINEARIGFNRSSILNVPAVEQPKEVLTAVPGGPTNFGFGNFMGTVRVGGLNAIGNFAIIGGPSNTYQFTDNLIHTVGNHSLKYGAEVRRMQMNGLFGTPWGSYTFNNLRDFLEARTFNFFGGFVAPELSDSTRGFRQTQFGIFLQDDYRVTRNLTINLGLRYEYNSPPTEQNGRLANVRNLGRLDLATGDFTPIDKTTTVGEPFALYPKDMFQPRVGFAWSFLGDEKTILRGGFGLFHDQVWMNLYGNSRNFFPFFQTLFVLSPVFLDPRNPKGQSIDQLPSGTAQQFYAEAPYAMQYNLQLQREIFTNTVVKIGYVGSQGRHLVGSYITNMRQFKMGPDGKPFWPNPRAPRMNPNFSGTSCSCQAWNSTYNSAQLEIERRFSKGLQLQGTYTWSRSIDDLSGPYSSDFNNDPGGPQFIYDRRLDRGLSSFDVKHKGVINGTWEVPFGRGMRWGSDLTGAGQHILGNWQIAGVVTLYTGYPFTIRNQHDQADSLGNHSRPNQIADITYPRTVEKWFDPSVFRLQPRGTLGNVGRNSLIGPTYKSVDMTLTKHIRLTEQKYFEFRAEFYNLFNHANFEAPINTQDAVGTGGDGESVFNSFAGVLIPTAGRIFRTVNNGRELQFGLKFIF